ncbi:hypothetical protein GCM10023264_23040 [Sphingomonas daechungensis]|uniref:hypothetical protein n=1 Tax=Sphingomonas daechungensis TaxID=1176646 RepID=UPI0031E9701F
MSEGSTDHSGANQGDLLAGHQAAAFLAFSFDAEGSAQNGGALDRDEESGNRLSPDVKILTFAASIKASPTPATAMTIKPVHDSSVTKFIKHCAELPA